jgi:2-polyprenyl-3-methyl-5-hydroxy-6-metoxy-1,4-benzoquinol methylase
MTQYRQVLYAKYHTNQSGRAAGTDRRSLFLREKRQFELEIVPLVLDLDRKAAVLDMGCGSGSLIAALKDSGFTQCEGIDVSEEQVALAHEMGVTEVKQGDLSLLLASSQAKWDLITGIDIIEHFTKDELVVLLQQLRKALKPGGRLVFRTPNLDAPMASVFANGDFTHENYLNAGSAAQVLMACGFGNVLVRPSRMQVKGVVREILRSILWRLLVFGNRLTLFATARSSRNVLFTPNMIILATKAE